MTGMRPRVIASVVLAAPARSSTADPTGTSAQTLSADPSQRARATACRARVAPVIASERLTHDDPMTIRRADHELSKPIVPVPRRGEDLCTSLADLVEVSIDALHEEMHEPRIDLRAGKILREQGWRITKYSRKKCS